MADTVSSITILTRSQFNQALSFMEGVDGVINGHLALYGAEAASALAKKVKIKAPSAVPLAALQIAVAALLDTLQSQVKRCDAKYGDDWEVVYEGIYGYSGYGTGGQGIPGYITYYKVVSLTCTVKSV